MTASPPRAGVAGARVLLAGLLAIAWSPAEAREIDAADLASLPPADVVVLGEVHDNPAHHENQAAAVRAIRPGALVFEMLSPAAAAKVGPDRADAETLAARIGWAESGWPDFALYHPIFTAAPDAAVFGAAVPREDIRRAATDGAAAVMGAGAAAFGLDAALAPADEAALLREQAEAHCGALPEALLPGMVEAQRLRDAALAQAVLAARAAHPAAPVVVITGNGHARRDRGVPALLARAAPELEVLAIGQFEAAPVATPPFDLWLVTAPAERGDPCEAFE